MNAPLKTEDRYRITGMDCAACARKIDTAVRRIDGVTEVSVSATAGTMTVERHVDARVDEKIAASVTGLGYGIAALNRQSVQPAARHAHDHDHAGHSHEGHDHDHDHDHAGHDHAGHDHAGHDHSGHDHSGHDHGGHEHGHGEAGAASAMPQGLHGHDDGPEDGPWWASPKARLTLFAGLAIVAAFIATRVAPTLGHWPFAVAMLVGLVPIARRAFAAARYGTPFSIETLMTIAAVGAVLIGASEEAAMVVFLFLIGEMLEGAAARRARSSIRGLAQLLPEKALLETGGGTREVEASALSRDAIIQVRPGDRIAADGIILSGESAIDEAPVTGESVPKRKGVGDSVFAGTINTDAVLRVKVTAVASDNTIARIVRLVEEAQEAKAPMERFIDRFSRWYTPGVLVVGALVAILPPLLTGASWDEWIYKGLAILLIGCPCALVISTPAAIAAGLASGARQGLLMKGGGVLEALAHITRIAFDKTGTLTLGTPVVSDVAAFDTSEADVLALAASIETGSNHPLARAILAKAAESGVAIPLASDIAAVAGKGMRGRVDGRDIFLGSLAAIADLAASTPEQAALAAAWSDEGKSVSALTVDGRLIGLVAMRDGPRPDAKPALRELAALGVKPIMLTGDNARAANSVGADLGIEVRAGLMPEDKQRIILELQAGGVRVAKVGDGINDAPALAAADVGIAMGGGTDVALETADAAILNNRVGDVARLIRLSRRTMRKIHQNIAIALGLKAVFLVTTILGITGLWPAILADTGATVLVTINALTLLAPRKGG
ncbi:heavy metal translocating P-type ATPase [Kaistia dalseonensis]|uniref:P-type Zn(2+) transporter n=1 Tax=Kaistia dalseonensis TaxID=410840 RepID=A0ABU0HCW4_9HYPH|nr:heavy metal translocating P-type ATPase [Kaistia dalseonensis]MCX5497527.1 heavy metal translocating P-type ATPase [Kaistia dalseonensis]MDQ0440166.1 Cd2+/Zn2+-exporting ATPase [Kaistia dalseonensis]